MQKWTGKNVTILGLSKSGTSSAKYLSQKGAKCIISENRLKKESDEEVIRELNDLDIEVEMGGHKEETLLNSDIVITSPGIPPNADVIKFLKEHKIQMTGEIGLAYMESSKPFIAITGTNGKTTTTKLVSEILTSSGLKAPACGNIGTPAISLVEQEPDYFVTEVSSFQIYTNPVFKPQIAVFLNYTPDHIDWHGSEQAYFDAKASLFTSPIPPNWSIINGNDKNVLKIVEKSTSEFIVFGREAAVPSVFVKDGFIVTKKKGKLEEIIALGDIPLLGKHNLENIMAAVAVAMVVGVEKEVIEQSIKNFIPPEHRLEYVTTIDDVAYYNDSKATNPDSTICALNSFDKERVVLIAGGRDKCTPLDELAEAIQNHANSVVLIGEAADRFEESFKKLTNVSIYRSSTLEDAIDVAGSLKLGPVLLSPACSSYDMFKNFEERGKAFKNYVTKKKAAGQN